MGETCVGGAESARVEIYCYADSSPKKWGKFLNGKKILSPNELVEKKNDVLIYISTGIEKKREIYDKLAALGLEKNIVGVPYFDKELYVDWNTFFDVETIFEGKNAIARGVTLRKCHLGYASYISENSRFFNTKIGRYSSVGPDIKMVFGQHPTSKFVSTHPIFYSEYSKIGKTYVENNIYQEHRYTPSGYSAEIGNDVWIGADVSIMEGVTIADGSIVAAGANVIKDTEPYSIVAGNPAKIVKYRFAEDDINFLLSIQWWNKENAWLDKYAKYFGDIRQFREAINEMEKI